MAPRKSGAVNSLAWPMRVRPLHDALRRPQQPGGPAQFVRNGKSFMKTQSADRSVESYYSFAQAPARERWYKRPFDLTVLIAAHLFPLLAPLWLLLWMVIPLLIWLEDRGPVFYRQRRMGRDGRVFTVLKFRTMVPNADKLGTAWTVERDPRITRVGRVLRKTALDELPELVSVWRGDMSFVGPRALDVAGQRLLEQQVSGFERRLQVRPGLTGMAQVYDLTDEGPAKLRFDLEYIRRMSLWLDTKLMLLSVVNTLTGRWDRRSGKGRQAHVEPVEEQQPVA
jgi:lipopolysaccharide/colanic/teichoic acid biosynthesis glycosyltransferase